MKWSYIINMWGDGVKRGEKVLSKIIWNLWNYSGLSLSQLLSISIISLYLELMSRFFNRHSGYFNFLSVVSVFGPLRSWDGERVHYRSNIQLHQFLVTKNITYNNHRTIILKFSLLPEIEHSLEILRQLDNLKILKV